ncbi:MAG: deoxyribodipyrimidine photolyase [Bacteroidetes bacterium]|nr:MAG: deoxyribodipyrimidine photolyase [Bacteroidota bacterium]
MVSEKPLVNVLWFKKDLRLSDHQPLKEAIETDLPLLLLFVFEPSIRKYPDWNIRHWLFQYYSLQNLNENLAKYQAKILIYYGEVKDVFEHLTLHFQIQNVFSHQETGTKITFDRDILMANFLEEQKIVWKEYGANGVQRGKKTKKNLTKAWLEMLQEPFQNPDLPKLKAVDFEIDIAFWADYKTSRQFENYPKTFQSAGEKSAWLALRNFVKNHTKKNVKSVAEPIKKTFSNSQISPYLTYGNLTSKQVFQFFKSKFKDSEQKNLDNFRLRLQWRFGCIQKFEDQNFLEFENLNATENIAKSLNIKYLQAWKDAKTGFPLVDACMRCVQETGFLNNKMRALLVSFLTQNLQQDWRTGVHFLAQQFLDYEPAIHFLYFQMQAGTAENSKLKIYNPRKKLIDKDFDSVFIKKWIPELKNVPSNLIYEPYKMTVLEQEFYQCLIGKTYPKPILDK